MADLDGVWAVKRTSGALPPLAGVRKRIVGARGYTEAGPLRLPFTVDGLTLRYDRPFQAFVDELAPDGEGFSGRALMVGREYGRFELQRIPSKEDQVATIDDQLTKYIDEALAMEQGVLRLLDSTIHGMDDLDVKDVLRQHKLETERHADRLRERLQAHGASPSLVREAGGILGAMMKGVLDLTRGEKSARGARDAYATEHLEIASYELLERVAQRAGDEETAAVARENRADEERMAAWLGDNWDRFAELALAEAAVRAAAD